MNNTYFIVSLIVIVVITGVSYFMFNQSATPTSLPASGQESDFMTDTAGGTMLAGEDMPDNKNMVGGDAMVADDTEMTTKSAGSYESYAPSKLAMAETGKVVLFFRAPWCPTCRALDADIKSHLQDIPQGVTILDVDYDSSSALKQKYGVTYQHTLVQVDATGNQLKKWSGSSTLAALVGQIQ